MLLIESLRNVRKLFFYDIVYEWEDDIRDVLSAKLCPRGYISDRFHAFAKHFPPLHFNLNIPRRDRILRFDMDTRLLPYKDCRNANGVYPAIIDFVLQPEEFDQFYKVYNSYEKVLVSSLEIVEVLKKHDCPLNIVHFPLSISDRYRFQPEVLNEKDYDVVLAGSISEEFLSYIERYHASHPSLKVLYRRKKEGKFEYYDKQGNTFVDYDDTRESYMRFLRKAKVAFYSTPGRDRKKDYGYNWVTPRFLELLCAGCAVLLQYTSSPDTMYYELETLWGKSIESYEEFETAMDNAMNNPIDVKKYSSYLEKHYTSVRAKQLLEILK